MFVTPLKHWPVILYVDTGGAAMMDVYQRKRLWASLSPRLVKPAPDHLPRDDEDDGTGKQDGGGRHSNAEKHPHALLVSHLSTDPEMNAGAASIESETRREVR